MKLKRNYGLTRFFTDLNAIFKDLTKNDISDGESGFVIEGVPVNCWYERKTVFQQKFLPVA